MKRRNAVLVAAAVAALAAAELVVLSSLLASEREGDRARYGEALASQRRDAGKALPVPDGASDDDDGDATLCVFDVDTFIVAVDEAFEEPLVNDDDRLDLARLETRSNLATRAARYVEQAAAGPALPQRLGRERDDGAWTELEPPHVPCKGDDASAVVRLELPEEPAAPESPATE